MSASRSVAPGFKWKRSRWGCNCPVALKEGKIIPGKPEFCLGFQDKFYILSSQEAYQKFVTNPRRYLLPPMPRPHCKVSIIGPPLSGKSTISQLLAQHYSAVLVDVEELLQPVLEAQEQERIDRIKEETTQAAVEKIKRQMESDEGQKSVTEDHPEVQALVLSAVEEAKKAKWSQSDHLCATVLQRHIKEIEKSTSDDEGTPGWVLDNFPPNVSQVDVLQEAGIQPDTIICLTDGDDHQVLKRLYEANKETVDRAIMRRIQEEKIQKENQDLTQKEQEFEVPSALKTVPEEIEENPEIPNTAENGKTKNESQAVVPQDHLGLGYPDCPEMNEYKLLLKHFVAEWEKMQFALNVTHCEVNIGKKSPGELLQEVLQHMEKPFCYESWELSAEDLEEESEEMNALNEQERGEDSISESFSAEEEEVDTTAQRTLGDTQHFCPVALQTHNVLWPCGDQIAAKYREKIYYFSSQEAKDLFLQNPAKFVSQTVPLKPPALRIFMLGTRGSGKTTQGAWLAQQLGLFHIQFREQLQMLIMAKTKRQVPKTDELVSLEDNSEDLDAKIKEAQGMEDTSANDNDCEVGCTMKCKCANISSY
uniref:Uncharacterized protein n=1 Tax=Gouania willdenowi TaxID=441366 RepID=A0A8C5I2P8_GOUWI